MVRKLIGALVGLAMMGMAGTASAVVFDYSYTGNPYTSAIGLYDNSMSVSVDFALDLPSASLLPFVDHTSDITSYVFSDGVQVYDESDTPLFLDFIFSTDNSGIPINWELIVSLAGPELLIRTSNSSSVIDQGVFDGTNFAASTSNPGTWTVTAAPEPSTLALFATGLALLAFLGWRRRGSKWLRAA